MPCYNNANPMPPVASFLLNFSEQIPVYFLALYTAKFLLKDEIKCEWFNNELLKPLMTGYRGSGWAGNRGTDIRNIQTEPPENEEDTHCKHHKGNCFFHCVSCPEADH